jgi:Zn-dependent metalloprotease
MRAPAAIMWSLGLCLILMTGMEIRTAMAAEKIDLRQIPPTKFVGKQISLTAFAAEAPLITDIIGPLSGIGVNDKFTLERQSQTPAGLTQLHLNQLFRNVPIWGERVILTRDKEEKTVRLDGILVGGIAKDIESVTPKLSAQDALKKMKDAVANSRGLTAEGLEFQNEKSRLVIYTRPTDNAARLSYEVSFFTVLNKVTGEATRPVFLVDGNSGETLYRYEGLTNANGTGPGGNDKTGKYFYGPPGTYPPLDVEQTGANCKMRTPKVVTENLKHGTSGSGQPFEYKCFENTFEPINGAFAPLNDAHHFAQIVYDMYRDWYKAEPLDPAKFPRLLVQVHYSEKHENAYWNGQSMTFGDGWTRFYPLVSIDVMGHEVSHGFTEYNSGLIYAGQSGGLNEAFSDMAGEAAESYNAGGKEPDFLVGAAIVKKPGSALRNLCNPTSDGFSIDNAKDYHDGIDVHHSSGVFNKAFCLLAKSPGWNARKAFHVFLVANQNYWKPTTDFVQGAQGAYAAAQDLGFNTTDVQKAFAAVGIAVP